MMQKIGAVALATAVTLGALAGTAGIATAKQSKWQDVSVPAAKGKSPGKLASKFCDWKGYDFAANYFFDGFYWQNGKKWAYFGFVKCSSGFAWNGGINIHIDFNKKKQVK